MNNMGDQNNNYWLNWIDISQLIRIASGFFSRREKKKIIMGRSIIGVAHTYTHLIFFYFLFKVGFASKYSRNSLFYIYSHFWE